MKTLDIKWDHDEMSSKASYFCELKELIKTASAFLNDEFILIDHNLRVINTAINQVHSKEPDIDWAGSFKALSSVLKGSSSRDHERFCLFNRQLKGIFLLL